MQLKNSLLTLATAFILIAMFVVGMSLATNNGLTADDTKPKSNFFQTKRAVKDNDWIRDENEEHENDWRDEDDDEDEGDNDWRDDEEDDHQDDEDEDEDDDRDDEHEGDEDHEHHGDENDFEEMEFHRFEIESNMARLEMMAHLAEVAKDEVAMASYALMHMEEFVEDEAAMIATLEELLESSEVSKPVKNLVKMKLAEVYSWSDQEDKALEVFKSMLKR